MKRLQTEADRNQELQAMIEKMAANADAALETVGSRSDETASALRRYRAALDAAYADLFVERLEPGLNRELAACAPRLPERWLH